MSTEVKTVLITDLDDTLWDWLNIWHSSFRPMFEEILRVTGVPEDEMISMVKSIHEKRGTSEYTFLLEDIEAHYGGSTDVDTIRKKYDAALHAFRRGRKDAQKLFPGVETTLQHIKKCGARIVAYTESQAYATIQRLNTTARGPERGERWRRVRGCDVRDDRPGTVVAIARWRERARDGR
jgi:phosphoglycolate phosphatase-like HAD superfamily hydrolase